MGGKIFFIIVLFLLTVASPLCAEEQQAEKEEGSIITLWPFFDYRESPQQGFSNLSILGPLFKFQRNGETETTAVRPFFYRTEDVSDDTSRTAYLYPLASSETWAEGKYLQVLHLFQKRTPEESRGTMLFPFYISGTSEKHGRYVSVFPLYGDIYDRFWKDEYHYVLFPLYGRTVKKGTETRNYLYPLFSLIKGEKEHGFQFWPLYGQSEKEGVYRKRFALWPVYLQEELGLDTDSPTRKFYLFPFYTSSLSKKRTEKHYLWPFFGSVSDTEKKLEERDYFWPFVVTVRSEARNLDRYLPFYSEDRRKNSLKRWYLWPFFSHQELNSDSYQLERNRVLFFLYSDATETWTIDGKSRSKISCWPLFTYRSDERGVKTVSFPAPVEPILNKEGIENSWAPLWRLYIQKWNDAGDSAASFLWNLYWHESRSDDLAYELFPFISYRSERKGTDLALLKGLIRYRKQNDTNELRFLWLPFGFEWGKPALPEQRKAGMDTRSGK
ncbi:MAG: hypothetical protein AB9919_06275 [Geobacteraceae bacterium]